jgi:hypothetical protein
MNPTPAIIALFWLCALVAACHGVWRAAGVMGGIALVVTVLLSQPT